MGEARRGTRSGPVGAGEERFEGGAPQPPGAARRGRSRFLWVRLVFGLALLGWVAVAVDLGSFRRLFTHPDPVWVVLSVAASMSLIALSAYKWRLLLRAEGCRLGFGACFRLYLVGTFYNQVLPTSIGGDVVRGYRAGHPEASSGAHMSSVFVERLTGAFVLALLALAAVLGDRDRLPSVLPLGIGALAGGVVLLTWIAFARPATRFLRRFRRLPLVRKAVAFREAVRSHRHSPRVLATAVILSLLFYGLAVVSLYCSARAFGDDLLLREALLAGPLIFAISMVPLSVGGLGLQEGAYVYVLALYGVSPAAALSTAVLVRAKSLLLGSGGFVVDLLGGGGQRRAPGGGAVAWRSEQDAA